MAVGDIRINRLEHCGLSLTVTLCGVRADRVSFLAHVVPEPARDGVEGLDRLDASTKQRETWCALKSNCRPKEKSFTARLISQLVGARFAANPHFIY